MDQEVALEISAETQTSSESFLVQWRTLVSTTNWQKGQIISQWRRALIDKGAPVAEYSDEAWSQLAGDLSSQHVGRLRRVYERFSETWRSYDGLYWTHFLAAYDWEDAEMWLEGSLQNDWSVAQMRRQRWETLGSLPDEMPLDHQVVAEETPDGNYRDDDGLPSDIVIEHLETVLPDSAVDPRSKRAAAPKTKPTRNLDEVGGLWKSQPLVALPSAPAVEELPTDFAQALEQFAEVIRKHKASGWSNLPSEVVLATLSSLKLLVADDEE